MRVRSVCPPLKGAFLILGQVKSGMAIYERRSNTKAKEEPN